MSAADSTPEETWRPIPGYDGYEASDQGRIRSRRRKKARVLSSRINCHHGYAEVHIIPSNPAAAKTKTVHRLVALAFFGPMTRADVVNHKDGCKTNNVLSNLEVVTYGVNGAHSKFADWLRVLLREEFRLLRESLRQSGG